MKAGPELDALIATKVMGASFQEIKDADYFVNESGGIGFDLPSYSTDIASAWLVVEKLRLSVLKCNHGWRAGDLSYGGHESSEFIFDAIAETAPHAICLAALKSVASIPKSTSQK